MGSAAAATLQNGGNEVLWASEGRSVATCQRAASLGLTDAVTLHRLAELCEIIVSVCPPEFADDTADRVLEAGFRGMFVDANAISPDRARRMDTRLRAAGITFVDGGIIGLATMNPGSTWIYLSGDAAAEAAAFFGPAPLQAEAMQGGIGQASALKMCFAGYNKGAAALLCAVLGAADRLGVRDTLERQWQRTSGSPANAAAILSGVAPKAWRFVPEMREIAATFASAGIPPEFHEAAAEIYSRLEGFKDAQPAYREILDALAAAAAAEAI
jgi:3-hydroxyisobutyrate dehydrogenase-like beta-hydroxyacid dehydrogenase